jgi:hypothetical protein
MTIHRYGCDVRLLQVLESLQSLNHHLIYGGKHVSDFETKSDKQQLKRLSIPLYAPLADGEIINKMKTRTMLSHNFLPPSSSSSSSSSASSYPFMTTRSRRQKSSPPSRRDSLDIVIMTLWFWNTRPIPEDFIPLVRTMAPQAKV